MTTPSLNVEEIHRVSREEIRLLFFRLGYDLQTPGEMRRLEQDLEWAGQRRQREINHSANVARVIWLFVTAGVGSVATALVEWLRSR
jgi:hypothetical protein